MPNVAALKLSLHDRIEELDEVELRAVYQFIGELKAYKNHRRIPTDKIWKEMVEKHGPLFERLGKM